jgi:hypothetical protein
MSHPTLHQHYFFHHWVLRVPLDSDRPREEVMMYITDHGPVVLWAGGQSAFPNRGGPPSAKSKSKMMSLSIGMQFHHPLQPVMLECRSTRVPQEPNHYQLRSRAPRRYSRTVTWHADSMNLSINSHKRMKRIKHRGCIDSQPHCARKSETTFATEFRS